MINTNLIEQATETIKELHEMSEYCVKNFHDNYTDGFPAIGKKEIEINGKRYNMTIEIKIAEI